MTNGIGRVGIRNYVSPLPTIWNNLTHYYSADNTAIDSKGSIHGTLVNGATYSTGKINAGFGLDGVNDYVNVGNLFGFDGTTPFSISFIFKLNANIANYSIKYLVGNQTRTAFPTNGTGAFLYTGDGGATNRLGFAMANNGNRLVVYIKNNLAINTFYHCVVSYNGNGLNSGLNTYINGVSEKLSVFSNSLTLPISSSSQLSTFGSTLGTSDFFNGVIDEVGVWDRALSATDVTELYNAGAGKQYVAPVVTAPTSTYTTRTAAFAIATGITDTTILNALNTFDTGLISNSLDTKMVALYPVVGGDATKHSYNFINTSLHQLTFFGGYTHTTTGMSGNAVNAYANTSLNNSTLPQDDLSLNVYSRTNLAQNTALIGCFTGARETSIFPRYGAGQYLYGLNGNEVGFLNSDSRGLFTVVRNSATAIKAYRNSTLVDSRTNNSTGAINENITISALNSGGSRYYFSSYEIAFVSISSKLSDSEVATFYNLVQAMQTTLSRQV